MRNNNEKYFTIEVKWKLTKNAEFPYETEVNEQTWTLRINDFPEEPMYTLLIDDQEVKDFSNWPSTWQKPND